MNAEDFFATPEAREPSRPRAVNPLTGKEQSWTRASNYAAALDNPHGLIKWQLRELVRGLALRPDLTRMILAGVPLEDDAKSKVDEIIDKAHGAAAIDTKANDGTAIHAALSRSWVHGIDTVAEEFHSYVRAFAAALKEYGLKPVATEQTVLNTRRDSRGTFDWAFQESDGAIAIGDVKSGKLDAAKRKFAVQCANYAEADFVLHTDGSASPIPWELRTSYAVLVHIDPETAAVSVYKLDLLLGQYGAELAEKVRQWHTLDPMSPYSPPVVPSRLPAAAKVEVVGTALPSKPASAEQAQQAFAIHDEVDGRPIIGTITPAEYAAGPATNVTHLPVAGDGTGTALPEASTNEVRESAYSAPETAQAGRDDIAEALAAPEKPYDPAERFDAFMKSMEKADLQMEIKRQRPSWTDLAHNRRWLARALVCIEQGWTDEKMIKKYAAAKDDTGGGTVFVEDAPTEAAPDRAATRREVAITAIAGAASVGALAAFHRDFVERHGDAAWTDELAEAAKARASELDGVDAAAILARVELCDEQSDLAELWSEVTLGGTVKSLWAPFEAAGKARMGVIRDRAMQQKNDNPFG